MPPPRDSVGRGPSPKSVIIHQYNGIRLSEVWLTVENDLPALKAAVTALLDSDEVWPAGKSGSDQDLWLKEKIPEAGRQIPTV